MLGITRENGNIYSIKKGQAGQLKENGNIYSIKKGQIGLFKGNPQKNRGLAFVF